MTWIYSSFAWRGNWSAEPQTVAVPCAVAVRGSPRQALELQVLSSSPPRACSSTLTFPRVCCFLFQKLQK